MSSQTSAKAIATANTIDAADADDDLLRGGKAIAKFIYRSGKPEDVKRLYAEAPRLPVFRTVPGGPLHAFKSRLRKHYEALSDAKEREIAEATEQRLLGVGTTPPKPRLKTNKPRPATTRAGAADRAAAASRSRHREREIA
jgi:hypothetical protein